MMMMSRGVVGCAVNLTGAAGSVTHRLYALPGTVGRTRFTHSAHTFRHWHWATDLSNDYLIFVPYLVHIVNSANQRLLGTFKLYGLRVFPLFLQTHFIFTSIVGWVSETSDVLLLAKIRGSKGYGMLIIADSRSSVPSQRSVLCGTGTTSSV